MKQKRKKKEKYNEYNHKAMIIFYVFSIFFLAYGVFNFAWDLQDYINNNLLNESQSKTNTESNEPKARFSENTFRNITSIIAVKDIYEKGIYGCQNMSEEIHTRLINAGYDSMLEVGCYGNDTECEDERRNNHEWVVLSLIIESTHGYIIPVQDYQLYHPHYRIMNPCFVESSFEYPPTFLGMSKKVRGYTACTGNKNENDR